jgi:Cu-Zn family superoxide dismutase
MPSVYFNSDGSVETRFGLDHIEPGEVIGKAVVLHVGPDNFGNVPTGGAVTQYAANSTDATGLTARTGNAGDRIACGVITP